MSLAFLERVVASGLNEAQIFARAVDRFFRAYLWKQGWRDGFLGYVMAVMGGMYQFVSYAKYWELQCADQAQANPLER